MSAQTPYFDGSIPLRSPRGPVHYAYWAVIIIQYTYLFSYNYTPEPVRSLFSASLFTIHLGLAAVTLLARPAAWNMLLLLSLALNVVTWIPAHFLGMGEVNSYSPVEMVKNIAFPLMLIWVLAYPMALPRRLLCWCAVLLTVIGAVIALTGPPVYVSGTPRLGSITSGFDNMHASAKLIALQILLLDQLRRARLIDQRLAWGLIGLGAVIQIGYEGRNELLFVLGYYATQIYFRLRHELLIRWSPPIVIGLCLVAATVILSIVAHPGNLGSGRIGVWSWRLWLISQRDPMTFLFGGGVGADFIWTPQWWFFDDGAAAHNDYLHIIMESGMVGLLAMFMLLHALWLRLTENGRCIVIAIMINSFFANGFFTSPLLAMSLSLVLATSMLSSAISDSRLPGRAAANARPPAPA